MIRVNRRDPGVYIPDLIVFFLMMLGFKDVTVLSWNIWGHLIKLLTDI
jgi:hypothetical protein